jgi:hypothetical protein
MAYTRQEQTQMPWWLQAVRHLQDNDGYNLPQQTPRMHVPASPVHSASDDEIDLTHTDNESESDCSTHTSDDDFIDDSEVQPYVESTDAAQRPEHGPAVSRRPGSTAGT